MTDVHVDAPEKCLSCGHELKASAIFCTGCGERRGGESAAHAAAPEGSDGVQDAPEDASPVQLDVAVGSASEELDSEAAGTACLACGARLKPGAEFCTECGVATVAPASPKDRLSPAASRAILGSVSGGMGSYVGKAGATHDDPDGPKGPGSTTVVTGDEDRKRRLLTIVVIAVALGLLGGIGLLIALQSNGDSSLHAGGSRARSDSSNGSFDSSSGTTGSAKSSNSRSSHTGSSVGGSSATTGSSGTTASGSSTTSGGSGSSSGGDSGGGGSSGGGSGGGGSSGGGSGGGGSSGGSSGGGGSAPSLRPGHVSVDKTNLSVSDTSGDTITVSNSGQRSTTWSISTSDDSTASLGGSLTFSQSSGFLSPGDSTVVQVGWQGGHEGTDPNGGFTVNGAGGPYAIGVSLDSTYSDTINDARCVSACGTANAQIKIQIVLGTTNGFRYTLPDTVCVQVTNGTNTYPQCWRTADHPVPGTWPYWQSGVGYLARIVVPLYYGPSSGSASVNIWDLAGSTQLGRSNGVNVF